MTSYLMQAFPALKTEPFEITSPPSARYNCIAWAAGRQTEWWWPSQSPDYHWPTGHPRDVTLEAFILAFGTLGFQLCEHGELTTGFEKLAVYALHGRPTHAARQLADGRWTSKLGKDVDIAHSIGGLEGAIYGKVVAYLQRPIEESIRLHLG